MSECNCALCVSSDVTVEQLVDAYGDAIVAAALARGTPRYDDALANADAARKDLSIRPITLRQARAFVQEHHRHHDMPQGGLWAIALMRAGELVGVAIAGRPVSRVLQRRGYCEIVRVCVLPGVPNGCSMLYARCRRIAQQMGYERTISYTLPSEGGASLRAAGFEPDAKTDGGSWSRPSRHRIDAHPTEPKIRWGAAA